MVSSNPTRDHGIALTRSLGNQADFQLVLSLFERESVQIVIVVDIAPPLQGEKNPTCPRSMKSCWRSMARSPAMGHLLQYSIY